MIKLKNLLFREVINHPVMLLPVKRQHQLINVDGLVFSTFLDFCHEGVLLSESGILPQDVASVSLVSRYHTHWNVICLSELDVDVVEFLFLPQSEFL